MISDLYIRSPEDSDCKASISYMAFTSCLLFLVIMVVFYTTRTNGKVNVLFVDQNAPIIFKTNAKFLSVALDTSVIANGFKNFNMSDPKLIKIIRHISPAYLRVGGNMADRLIFSPDNNTLFKTVFDVELDGGDCSYNERSCIFQDKPNFTMNGIEWLKLYNLTKNTQLDMVFDLNVLRRFPNDSWNPANAKKLIEFSDKHGLNLHWQLGNEPNNFRHQFNYEVNATQLAADFKSLKKIIRKYKRYNKSLLIGPDTTRPDVKSKRSIKYLTEFLENAGNVIDVISWHQYYFNGRTADAHDFLDPEIFNILAWQISKICKIKTDMNLTEKPLWLAETSSAWGGGSPLFSDRFIAGFIWLDKLGLSAKMGIDIVIRQSIFNGYYALIGDDYNPNPDYWISILYKKLVGQEVIPCYNVASKNIRLYCHCTNNIQKQSFPSVTVFGMNMQDVSAKIRIEGLSPIGPTGITPLKILSYTLTSKVSLLNKNIYLNGEILKLRGDNELPNFVPKVVDGKPYVIMPPYSIVFWVIPTKNKICYNLD